MNNQTKNSHPIQSRPRFSSNSHNRALIREIADSKIHAVEHPYRHEEAVGNAMLISQDDKGPDRNPYSVDFGTQIVAAIEGEVARPTSQLQATAPRRFAEYCMSLPFFSFFAPLRPKYLLLLNILIVISNFLILELDIIMVYSGGFDLE